MNPNKKHDQIIFNLIDDYRIKEFFKHTVIDDHWKNYSRNWWLKRYNKSFNKICPKLNYSDKALAYSIIGRCYGLKYIYNSSLKYYNSGIEILKFNIPKPIQIFIKQNYAITCGYIGIYNKEIFKYLEECSTYYEENKLIDEYINLNLTEIHIWQLDYNYNIHSLRHYIEQIKGIAKKYPSESKNHFINFNLAVIYFRLYLKGINANNNLKSSFDNFQEELDLKSDDKKLEKSLKYIWTQWGLLATAKLLNIKSTIKPVSYSLKKAGRFPLLQYFLLIIRSQKNRRKILRNMEGRLKGILSNYPDEFTKKEQTKFQKNIFTDYKVLIEKWIYDEYKLKNENINAAAKFMIHANEILQNRILNENLLDYSNLGDNENNVSNLLDHLWTLKENPCLIYMTNNIKVNSVSYFFIIKLSLNNKFVVINRYENKINYSCTQLAKMLFNGNKENQAHYFIVPKNQFIYTPFSELINEENPLRNITASYLPNLKVSSSLATLNEHEKLNMCLLYTSESPAPEEAELISKIIGTDKVTMVKDPSLADLKNIKGKYNLFHVITVYEIQKKRLIFGNGSIINKDDFIANFPSEVKSIVLNICHGGVVEDPHDIDNQGIIIDFFMKGISNIISYNSLLDRDASKNFSKQYYNNLKNDTKPLMAFNRTLEKLDDNSSLNDYFYWGI